MIRSVVKPAEFLLVFLQKFLYSVLNLQNNERLVSVK